MKSLKEIIKIILVLVLAGLPVISIHAQQVTLKADTAKMQQAEVGSQEAVKAQNQNKNQNQAGNAAGQQAGKQNAGQGKIVKQVKGARPDLSKAKGARPNITRPSGSGVPKGVGKPGGVGRMGRR